MLPRRGLLVAPLALAACRRGDEPDSPGWPKRWDRLLLEHEISASNQRWDEKQGLLQALLTPGYKYHTKLRDARVHPTRESLEYALYLLELGGDKYDQRAFRVIDRVLSLQVTDPESRWYGIWGWYSEEPPDKMAPADWNWADFNGALLLLIDYRHGARLTPPRRARLREAAGHAARSIERRNVSMTYTNIAVQGTFVTLAAAELLADSGLSTYASDRMRRLEQTVRDAGSFAEYNSPTYARVTLTNLTRIRMYVKDAAARAAAARLETRLWQHLADHWDAARKQFAGPMSRCYDNDLGYPAWLEKALDRRLGLMTMANRSGSDGETAIHDFRCPPELAPRFLSAGAPHTHREVFSKDPETVGTSYFSPAFSLGSVNRGDFWQQRRPLLAYFGDASRPARTLQLRVVKDGFDFASALLFSVQHEGRLLGVVNFKNPGGNRHVTLDPIENGEFDCGRIFLELDFEGLPEGFSHAHKDGWVELKSNILCARFRLLGARFGSARPELKVSSSAQSLTVTMDFKPLNWPKRVKWAEIQEAWAAFALELAAPGTAWPEAKPALETPTGRVKLNWDQLSVEALAAPASDEQHQRAFRSHA